MNFKGGKAMNKMVGFLIILAFIILYSVIGYTTLPYKGIISVVIILAVAVVCSVTLKKKK